MNQLSTAAWKQAVDVQNRKEKTDSVNMTYRFINSVYRNPVCAVRENVAISLIEETHELAHFAGLPRSVALHGSHLTM
jgi:hypothetical protein